MKAFLVALCKRFGELILKMVSAKTVSAGVVTVLAWQRGDATSIIVVAVMWLMVIGIRYAEKAVRLVKGE
jgi:hypothetical protein